MKQKLVVHCGEYSIISRLQRLIRFQLLHPGALPQAVTFRAFGAETGVFVATYRVLALTRYRLD
ncbi:MAG: hypothetical protein AABN95_10895 [Acidobacteriota bacterium]